LPVRRPNRRPPSSPPATISASSGLAGWRPRRLVGDLAADGKGEWLLPG
jgi:hypothetical protein